MKQDNDNHAATPGPWRLEGIHDDHGATAAIAVISVAPKKNTWYDIAQITSPHANSAPGDYALPPGETFITDEDWANAHLIAAAPETAQERDRLKAMNVELVGVLEYAEDILGFQEGSEEVIRQGGEPVIWLNANGPDGDFQTVLAKLRAALAKAHGD